METKPIEYIITIAKHRGISEVADELYLTQPTLNQQFLKLERKLGAPLLVRTRNHWEPTDIGKLYEERSRQILETKSRIYSQIQNTAKKWKGATTIGLTLEGDIQMFTAIYPIIHAQCPDTTFQPIGVNVESQLRMMDTREMDINFQTIFERRYKHPVYKIISYEPFYLCIPRIHPPAYGKPLGPSQYPEISLKQFGDELFTLVKKSSTMRVAASQLLKKVGLEPKLLFESASMRTMLQLTEDNQCRSAIPRYYAVPSEHVSYFSLGLDTSWELAAVRAQNHYINSAAKDFIRMAVVCWRAHPYSD